MSTLHGLKIRLERSKDVPCGACGTTTAAIGQDNDLYCATCGRRRGRLPEAISNFLTEAIAKFGRPSEAIVIKDSEGAALSRTSGATSDSTRRSA